MLERITHYCYLEEIRRFPSLKSYLHSCNPKALYIEIVDYDSFLVDNEVRCVIDIDVTYPIPFDEV